MRVGLKPRLNQERLGLMNTRGKTPRMEQHKGGVGPYRFGRRLRIGEGLGRLYEARHKETGAPSLILVPTGARTDLAPQVDLELRVHTSATPAFIVLEMESCPAGSASDVEAELSDVTEDLADVVQAALTTTQKLSHLMSGRVPVPPRPNPEFVPVAQMPRRGLRVLTALSLAATGILLAVQVKCARAGAL